MKRDPFTMERKDIWSSFWLGDGKIEEPKGGTKVRTSNGSTCEDSPGCWETVWSLTFQHKAPGAPSRCLSLGFLYLCAPPMVGLALTTLEFSLSAFGDLMQSSFLGSSATLCFSGLLCSVLAWSPTSHRPFQSIFLSTLSPWICGFQMLKRKKLKNTYLFVCVCVTCVCVCVMAGVEVRGQLVDVASFSLCESQRLISGLWAWWQVMLSVILSCCPLGHFILKNHVGRSRFLGLRA